LKLRTDFESNRRRTYIMRVVCYLLLRSDKRVDGVELRGYYQKCNEKRICRPA